MDKVMVSWNVPNLITINLMAWLGFLFFMLAWQAVGKKRSPLASGTGEVLDSTFSAGA